MIIAEKNGRRQTFTEETWNLLKHNRRGWVQVEEVPDAPAEVTAKLKEKTQGKGKEKAQGGTTPAEPPVPPVEGGEGDAGNDDPNAL